jgi:hypothetical protein
LYCLSFLLTIVLFVFVFWPLYCLSLFNGQKTKTNNTMVKRQRQTIQWSKDKDKQYNDQKTKTNNTKIKRQRQTIQR